MVGLNLFTLKEKNTTKINYQEINSIKNLDQNLNFQKTFLPENKLTESLEFYQNLEKQRINSLGLYLNLIEINKANKNQDEINKYLEKAQLIDPKIIYLEN